MTAISEPYVTVYRGEKPEDWGVTGFVIIAESHIAIHTYPERGMVWADVFSCKDFDASAASGAIGGLFLLTDVTSNVVDRGLERSAK